jgi:hypothetical protein
MAPPSVITGISLQIGSFFIVKSPSDVEVIARMGSPR